MATKAAKSITINATKYELANDLDVSGGKIQLKAKDVVLGEVDAPGGGFVITMEEDGDFFSDGTKNCESFACQDLIDAIKDGKAVYIAVPKNLDSNDNHTDYAIVPVVAYYSYANMTIWLSFVEGTDMYSVTLAGYPTTVSSITVKKNPTKVIVEASLTSDAAINQIGISAGWRGMLFSVMSFAQVVALITAGVTVYIYLKGSGNQLTVFAPLTLTRRFAADMWSSELTFVADGSVFIINDTPEIKRTL